jgi:streptomycin 6-kinase
MRAETLGEKGARWIAGLDECVEQLAQQWELDIGELLAGGSESLVAHALLGDGRAAVLKIGLPGSADLSVEAKVYALAAGRGYAELIAHDPEWNAILLERLGPALRSTTGAISVQIHVICSTLQEAWIPLDSSHGLMTGAQKAGWLASFIREKWQLLDRPCDKSTIQRALEFSEERIDAYASNNSVLVHGDAHPGNALMIEQRIPCVTGGPQQDEAYRCKFVDPDGLFAEKACDLAVLMRDWSHELLAGDALRRGQARCELLAALTGVDERAIWQWGFIERVSTGLHMLELGLKSAGMETLAVADQFNRG